MRWKVPQSVVSIVTVVIACFALVIAVKQLGVGEEQVGLATDRGEFEKGEASGSLKERVGVLENEVAKLKEVSTSPVVFGEWQLTTHSEEHEAMTDGIVVVRSHGGNGEAEADFEIFVEVQGGQFRAVSRGGAHQAASAPVPRGSRWKVTRGGKSNEGSMSVHWLPLAGGDGVSR